jgi:mono/diheme cytochrome c family protein
MKNHPNRWPTGPLVAVGLGAVLALAACSSVEVQNTQAAHEIQQQKQQAAGSVYSGWRVYEDKCARCHGPAATGLANAPDLLARMRTVGPRQFVDLVLRRYDWGLGPSQPNHSGPAWDAMVDDVMQRKQGNLTMPAWEGEPRVTAHITDLYAYLAARSQGTQGPGRPTP